MPLEFSFSQLPTHSAHNQWSHHIWGLVYIYLYLGHGWVITVYSTAIHDSHEIAILQFPTSDCSQNEAWCHAKRTDVTTPIENTWRQIQCSRHENWRPRHCWCAILSAHQLLWQNMEAPVSIFQESPLAGEPRERLFHIHSTHRYQLCAKYLYPSTLLWQMNGCNP